MYQDVANVLFCMLATSFYCFKKGKCMKLCHVLILFTLLLPSIISFTGFVEGTLVKVPNGYCPIEELEVGDLVYVVNADGSCGVSRVKLLAAYVWHKYVIIDVDGQQIVAASGQKIYQPEQNKWHKAKHLTSNSPLLSGLNKVRHACSVEHVYEKMQFYDIRLDNVHTFCVSEHDIVVHNFPPCMIGFSIAWGCGAVVFEKFYIGLCIAGLWFANTLLMKGKHEKPKLSLKISTEEPYKGGQDPDPKDPKQKSKFVPAPYHKDKRFGKKSAGPNVEEGQKVLDNSVLVVEKGNTKYQRRVGVTKTDYVVLDETVKNEFHGHYRSWEKPTSGLNPLTPEMRSILIKNKITTAKGKIL